MSASRFSRKFYVVHQDDAQYQEAYAVRGASDEMAAALDLAESDPDYESCTADGPVAVLDADFCAYWDDDALASVEEWERAQ